MFSYTELYIMYEMTGVQSLGRDEQNVIKTGKMTHTMGYTIIVSLNDQMTAIIQSSFWASCHE